MKLNVNAEKDIIRQLDQYISVTDVKLNKKKTIHGNELLPYVLIIDTEKIYLYNGEVVKDIIHLDNLTDFCSIDKLKEKLYEIIV